VLAGPTSRGAEADRAPSGAGAALQKIGTTKGLCVVLGVPDAGAVVELARASELTLYIQSADAGAIRAARDAAEAVGLLGRRIFVDEGVPHAIDLADNLADAVLVADRETPIDRRELTRVLRPGGVAIVGAERITKPAPAGTDSWSHPYHGPDNNPLSTDQLARAPYRTQFLAEPLFSSQPEVTVAAGGRVFKAFGHMTFRAYQNASINTLFAMSAYNGAILWTRPLKPGFMIHRNTMIATPDTLFLADDDSCKLIDAATGRIKDEIVPPEGRAEGKVWKWMAIEDNILYALLGPDEVKAPVAKGTDPRIGGWPWGMWPGYEYRDPKTAWGFGRTFLAIDLKTRDVLWSHAEEKPLDSRGVCMSRGRIYFYCPDTFLGCLDAKTGRPVWKTSDPALLMAIGPHEKAQHYVTGFATTAYMKCAQDVLMFAGPQRSALVAVSAADGKLLWHKKGGNFQLVLRDDAIYALGDQFGKSYKLAYATGEALAEFVGRRACTRATGTVDSVFCRATEGTIRWDVATNRLQHIAPMRPACHDGVVVSDGHLYWGPWICGCHLTLVGTICLTPTAGAMPEATTETYEPLRQFRDDLKQVQSCPTSATDWPSYQADNRRSRTSRVAVPLDASLRWTYTPSSPGVPTAPVAAGGLVFVGGSDGLVRVVDAATGALRWKASTGGSIFFPPAIAQGRAYVGSNDGRIYAFEAATGRDLWRFRAGPAARKIPVYGEIVSTWPVAGGVVVTDGVLYAAAGISHFDGTHVVALDAVTGQLKWHNSDSGTIDTDVQNGVSLCGSLALDDRGLSFPGGNVYVTASYDPATGQCRNAPAGPKTSRRIFLWPRKLWEPIEVDDLDTSGGTLRARPARGGQVIALSFHERGAEKPVWSRAVASYRGAVAASNALLVLAQDTEREAGQPAPPRLFALKPRDGSALWSHPLPAAPVHHGLAIDAAGRVFVALEDSRILGFAARDATNPNP
jgi:outer membrane protein assembly factor BamB